MPAQDSPLDRDIGDESTDATSRSERVAIVVPLFNAQEYIEATLDSVRAQDWPSERLQVIVVDDGSTDDGAALAEQWLARSGLRHELVRATRGGPSRARNLGWRRADAEWIQFLDADDVLAPQKIRQQLDGARNLPSEVAVLYCPWQRLGASDGGWLPIGPVERPQLGVPALVDLIRDTGFLTTGACLFRRAWLERVGGYDETLNLIEDVHLAIRIAIGGGALHFAQSAHPLFFYRQRPGSLSRSDSAGFAAACVRNARLVEDHLRARDALSVTARSQLCAVYFLGARHQAGRDWHAFEALVCHIETLMPRALPPGPLRLRHLSRILGYRRAERVATAWRRAKRALRSSSR